MKLKFNTTVPCEYIIPCHEAPKCITSSHELNMPKIKLEEAS